MTQSGPCINGPYQGQILDHDGIAYAVLGEIQDPFSKPISANWPSKAEKVSIIGHYVWTDENWLWTPCQPHLERPIDAPQRSGADK